MASTRKLRSLNLADSVAGQIGPLVPPQSSILVGLSGGVDSVVLLHLLAGLSVRFSWNLSALHVHHGISANADDWSEFCVDLCSRLHVPLTIEHIDIAPIRGHGIEAAARKLRRAAFAKQPCDFVAVAHHADDQAETLLLQLLRGTGVRGASAMPQFAVRPESVPLVRPLLHCSRKEILDYAMAHHLRWIEDESNNDDSYPRNYLRHQIMPRLAQKFPAYRETLMRGAEHFAEASHLVDILAIQDAAGRMDGEAMEVDLLRLLDPARARNVLRYFLHANGAPMPQAVQLDDMLRQLAGARHDAAVCVDFGGWQIRRFRGRAYVMRSLQTFDRGLALPWRGEAELEWPALGVPLRIDVEGGNRSAEGSSGAISMKKLERAPVTFRLRCGGECIRPGPARPTRSLKNLMQEYHIPPWKRDRLPLLYCGEDLVCATGVAVAAEYQPIADERVVRIHVG